MKHIEEVNTAQDVKELSTDNILHIDRYDIEKRHADFNNQEVTDAFAYEWVLRGL